jgi:hypothetical protein
MDRNIILISFVVFIIFLGCSSIIVVHFIGGSNTIGDIPDVETNFKQYDNGSAKIVLVSKDSEVEDIEIRYNNEVVGELTYVDDSVIVKKSGNYSIIAYSMEDPHLVNLYEFK